MIFKFIAPFETGFDLHTFRALSNKESYTTFWDDVKKELFQNYSEVDFLHTTNKLTNQKFTAITADANTLTAEILDIGEKHLKDSIELVIADLNKNERFSALIRQSVYLCCRCKISDNNVGILELDIDIPYTPELSLQYIEEVQEFSNLLLEKALKVIYPGFIKNLFSSIHNIDKNWNFVKSFESKAEKDIFPLWVNRSLYIDQMGSSFETLAEYWLSISHDSIESIVDEVTQEGIYLGWGHNILSTETNPDKVRQAVEALHLCQYYNAVLESFNTDLTKLIGESFLTSKVNKKTKILNKKLNDMLSNTKLLLIQLNETKFNLQDFKQYYFLDLLEKWKIEKIKDNLEDKMKFCQDKIQEIYQKQTKKNQFIMEVILFSIGGIALVEFFTNVSQYSFELLTNTNRDLLNYEYGDIPGFLNVASKVTPNGMIWSGFILLFITFLIYTILRFRSR